ncbi:hypothetical protein FNH13_00545 [Ornithinimicrobium ciconiae]|uniref:Uncharacterized protein n=1 Tax=Ornithinimicrobium ciconiae TaxID=2594265 RepID=A0A516G6I0_9MICO|nr:hypothetical protein [Ornithinimicrobium ciconiae]QDO86990.1 hypothetical protein FNH13_00545 [Ornithinimicrobium ciconiae]
MTRKNLHEVLDQAVGQTPRVDLAEGAWARGVGMRRRRRAAFAGGGAVLAATAVAGALAISGGLAPDEDMAPAVPTGSSPTQGEPSPTDGAELTGTPPPSDSAPSDGDPASWRLLDPGSLTMESQTLRVGVTRAGCSGGRTGQVLEPVVTAESDRVLVRIDVEPLPSGEYACPGNDEVEVDVVLDEPLGRRDLFDLACQDTDYPVPCDDHIQWAHPRGEPVEVMVDPYLIATTPQEFADWGSHVVWVEVLAEREVEPRYPGSLGADQTAREVDLYVRDVMWSHPEAITPVSWDEVITLEVSPGWSDGQPAVLESDTRLEVGHEYVLALVDTYDDGEQYLDSLLGSVTEIESPAGDLAYQLYAELENITPDPDRAPRPGEAWDARFMRVTG